MATEYEIARDEVREMYRRQAAANTGVHPVVYYVHPHRFAAIRRDAERLECDLVGEVIEIFTPTAPVQIRATVDESLLGKWLFQPGDQWLHATITGPAFDHRFGKPRRFG